MVNVITAADLAASLGTSVMTLIHPGAERPVLELELVEPGDAVIPAHGALVLAVGTRDIGEALEIVEHAGASSGLVMRGPWATEAAVRARCGEAGLPLLAVSADVNWSSVVDLLRSELSEAASTEGGQRSADQVHHDLFELADRFSAILAAPVTIEDATSRVLAYSTGQDDVDDARMSTIVGRQVPRRVRDHFRALGVFRRLATSDAPVFIPSGEDGVKARYVVPVRAGGEWLGSIWAVKDVPASDDQAKELHAATEIVALCLVRVRAQGELNRQIQLDQIRSVLRGGTTARPSWLDDGPWRVAILTGPLSDAAADARCQLWHSLTRRRGWQRPLIADIDATVYTVVRETGTGVGSWTWLKQLVAEAGERNPTLTITAGGPVSTVGELHDSRETADELATLVPDAGEGPVVTIESAWTAVVLSRAVAGLASRRLVSPLKELLDDERRNGGDLVDTLAAVIDHWGEPRRAASALDVHPNTVRYRLARLAERCPLDLADPAVRLALRLEIARDRISTRPIRTQPIT